MRIETIKYFIQSANINFLYGSGLSRPYLVATPKKGMLTLETSLLHHSKFIPEERNMLSRWEYNKRLLNSGEM